MSKFHEIINKLKNEKGIQQNELAHELNITSQSLSYYMNGREPKYDILIKIARFFDVSVDYLLGVSPYRNYEHKIEIDNSLENFADVIFHSNFANNFLINNIASILSYDCEDIVCGEKVNEVIANNMSAYVGFLKLITDKWRSDNSEAQRLAFSLITIATNLNHDIFENPKTSQLLNLYNQLYTSKDNPE